MADFTGTTITNMNMNVMQGEGTRTSPYEVMNTPDKALGYWDMRATLWNRRAAQYDQYFQQSGEQVNAVKYWRYYRAWKQPMTEPLDWWRSNEVIPTCFKIIETLFPKYLFGLFHSPDWFSVRGTESSDELWENAIQQLLKEQLEEMELVRNAYEGLKYMTIMGHVWWKVFWKEEWRKQATIQPKVAIDPATGSPVGLGYERAIKDEKVTDRPHVQWIGIDRIKTKPDGSGEWFIEEYQTTVEDLQQESKRLGGIYSNLDLIPLGTPVAGTGVLQPTTGYIEPQSTEAIPINIARTFDGTPCTVWQCWGRVPPQLLRPGDAEWRLMIIVNKQVVIRDVEAPTPDGKPPYFGTKCIPIPGNLFGDSILKWVGPLVDQQTRLANHRLDEVMLNVWGQLIINANAGITNNEMFYQPGGALFVNGNPNDLVAPLKRPPIPPEVYNEDNYRQSQAEHTAGASDVMQGITGPDRPTTGDTQMRLQQGSMRNNATILWLDETWKKPLVKRVFDWLRMRMPGEKLVRVIGVDGYLYETMLDITKIQIPMDIVVSGGLLGMSKEEVLSDYEELVAFGQSPVYGPYIKADAVLSDYFKEKGRHNVSRYIRTEAEVVARQLLGFDPTGMGGTPPGAGGGSLPMQGDQSGGGMAQLPESASPEASPEGS